MIERAFRGTTIVIEFGPLLDALDAEIDLTGATVTCKAKLVAPTTGTEVFAGQTMVVTPGRIARAEFEPVMTNGFTVGGLYRYDGVATFPTGRVLPLGQGTFRVEELLSVDT